MARAASMAYVLIRDGILNGRFARGERLREEQLASQAGVSRTPVREALRRLDAEGLVEFIPNRGARVTAWSGPALDDLYDLRAILEGHGARLAATRKDPDALAELESMARKMDSLSRKGGRAAAEEVTALNGEFHRLIVRTAQSPHLESALRGIMDVSLIYRTLHRSSADLMTYGTRHHLELVEALRAGDGDWAESIMRAHILAAKATVQQLLKDERSTALANEQS